MTRISVLIISSLLALSAGAQFRDAGLWVDYSLSTEFKKDFEFSISPEIRLDENLSRLARAFADVGAQYKITKQFFVSVTYRGGMRNDGEFYDPRHRFQFGLGIRRKAGDFTFTYQPRWQAAVKASSSENDADFVTTMRNKLQVKYTGLKGIDLSTSFEVFNNSTNYQGFVLQNWRWVGDIEKKINKQNSFSLGYLIQKSLLDSPQQIDFVILASYKMQLNLFGKKKDEEKEPPVDTK